MKGDVKRTKSVFTNFQKTRRLHVKNTEKEILLNMNAFSILYLQKLKLPQFCDLCFVLFFVYDYSLVTYIFALK